MSLMKLAPETVRSQTPCGEEHTRSGEFTPRRVSAGAAGGHRQLSTLWRAMSDDDTQRRTLSDTPDAQGAKPETRAAGRAMPERRQLAGRGCCAAVALFGAATKLLAAGTEEEAHFVIRAGEQNGIRILRRVPGWRWTCRIGLGRDGSGA